MTRGSVRGAVLTSLALVALLGQAGAEVSEWAGPVQETLDLAGHEVVVRIYDLPDKPAAYSTFTAQIPPAPGSGGYERGPSRRGSYAYLEIDTSELPLGTALLVVGSDQQDPAVAAALTGTVQTWLKDDNTARFRLNPHAAPYTVTIADALRAPIPNATVRWRLVKYVKTDVPRFIELGPWRADDEGRIDLPAISGDFREHLCVVSHPDYGTGEARFWNLRGEPLVRVPLLENGVPVRERGLAGVVLGPDGRPVADAKVTCTHILTLGQGLVYPDRGDISVLTGKDGRFFLYPPLKATSLQGRPRERGNLLPPKSRYHFRVDAPKKLGLFRYTGTGHNGGEILVKMESGQTFHTFKFVGREGPLPDWPEKWGIMINHTPPGSKEPRTPIERETVLSGGKVPPGTLTVVSAHHVNTGEHLRFQPVTVTPYSPLELVFYLRPAATYRGRVVHGITGAPMAGILIISMTGKNQKRLCDITSVEWGALHSLREKPDLQDPALTSLHEVYDFNAVVRTDREGRYALTPDAGKAVNGILASEQDFIGFSNRVVEMEPGQDGVIELPPHTLFPAATVSFELDVHGRSPSVSPYWDIRREGNPKWAEALIQGHGSSKGFVYNGWLPVNEATRVHVPAGLELRLRLHTPYDPQWRALHLPGPIRLEQREQLELGEQALHPATRVSVQVVDEDGTAVEGIPVRKLLDGQGSVAHNSDENGKLEFYLDPGAEGSFYVSYHDMGMEKPEGPSRGVAECSFDIPESGEVSEEFVLVLRQEVIEAAFR